MQTLDIDHFLARPKDAEVQETLQWVEQAYDQVERVFEGCITDRLRQLFQEVK